MTGPEISLAAAATAVGSSAQPVLASATRALERLAALGEPVPSDVLAALPGLDAVDDPGAAVHELLSAFTLVHVELGEYGFVRAEQIGAPPVIPQSGWRSFLVRLDNPSGRQGPFALDAAGRDAYFLPATSRPGWVMPSTRGVPDRVEFASTIRGRTCELVVDGETELSGVESQYLVASVYSRDAGEVGVTMSLGFPHTPPGRVARWMGQEHLEKRTVASRSATSVDLRFEARPGSEVTLDIRDVDGRSCVAAVTITDDAGRVYPSRAMRIAPDMFFQPHVYRGTGETVELPAGDYDVTAWRGIEYLPVTRRVSIGDGAQTIPLQLERWIMPAARSYYSGDPHLHAGGCAHYSYPTEGVSPETMVRHARGEGLWIADVLSWGQCHYYQRRFFTGESISPPATLEHPELQEANGVRWTPRATDTDGETSLQYDLEISGFPSSHSGHILLLGLADQDYPGTSSPDDWPSWNLPIHRWARAQGAFTGHPHSGIGMIEESRELPQYEIPPFSSIGANEFFVDVANGFADFIGVGLFAPVSELNIWYHLLNAGFTPHILGETDYPCMSDDRPGVGRTYVKLAEPPAGPGALRTWIEGIKRGPSYVGDGRSHVFDLAVDGDEGRYQTRATARPVRVTASVAALLPPERPDPVVPGFSFDDPEEEWNLEYARIPGSRSVAVELVVNGVAVASREVVADGSVQDVGFDLDLDRSAWIALRILPSLHTQPVFVEVGGLPVRASRRSAQWLIDCVEKLWDVKNGFIRAAERADARQAYDDAKRVFADRLAESEAD